MRKTDRQPFTPELLAQAITLIRSGMSVRRAAATLKFSESTVRKAIKRRLRRANSTSAQEGEIVIREEDIAIKEEMIVSNSQLHNSMLASGYQHIN